MRHAPAILTETTDTYLLLRAFVDELARCGLRRRLHVAGLALDAARAHAGAPARACGLVARRRARGRASSRSAWPRRAGGRSAVACTSRDRGRALPARGDRGARGARAAARAHRRPPAGAARGRRRPDDRPAQALRRRGEVVLRGRHARRDARAAALDAPARLPRATGPRVDRAPRRRAPELRRCASRSCSTRRCRRRRRPTPAVPARRGARVRAGPPRSDARASAGRARHRRRPPRARRRRSPRRCAAAAAAARRAAARRPALRRAARPGGRRPLRRAAARRGASPPRHAPDIGDPRRRPADLASRCASGSPASAGARQVAFDPEGAWQDPAAVVGEVLDADPARAGRARSPARRARARGSTPGARADDAAAAAIAADARRRDLSEPRVARALGARCPSEVTALRRLLDAGPRRRELLAGARRAAARAGQPRRQRHRRHARRGLRRRRRGAAASCVHLGDVALAHDLGALLSASRLELALTIVLVDNAGGGIFDFLPVAIAGRRLRGARRHADRPRRRARRRPLRPATTSACERRSARSARPPGRSLHVRTDRAENVALHRRLHEAVAVRLAR